MTSRTSVRPVALTLSGVAIGALLSGALVSRSAVARDHEDHMANPRIHHALDALHDAQAELSEARTDFHGHKRDAQAAVDHAIDELDRIKDW
jgi:hypothetical protein